MAIANKGNLTLGLFLCCCCFATTDFNAPKFFVELKDNTVPRYLTVVGASFGIAIGLFAAIGGLGFLTFGAHR
jgi:hypothetical protein